jgi:hypothetical protein
VHIFGGLFNDANTIADYIASNGRMVNVKVKVKVKLWRPIGL